MPSSRSSASSTGALWILTVLAALAFLRYAMELLVPIVIGVLASLALEPIVAWLERHRVPRLAGALLVMLLLAGGTGLTLYSLRLRRRGSAARQPCSDGYQSFSVAVLRP
jgi:predicted PurR-regulated permease PerM